MNYRFVCFGKNIENLRVSLERGVVGFKSHSVLEQVSKGDVLFLYVNSAIVAVAKVESSGFESNETIWVDKVYPFRYQISVCEIIKSPQNFLTTPSRDLLYSSFGSGWGYKFMYSPRPIPGNIADQILNDLGFRAAQLLNKQQGLGATI